MPLKPGCDGGALGHAPAYSELPPRPTLKAVELFEGASEQPHAEAQHKYTLHGASPCMPMRLLSSYQSLLGLAPH